MLKPISISLSPNTESDDILLAFKLQFSSWLWQKGRAIGELEKRFQDYIGMNYAASFNSGRSALVAILDSLNLTKDSEVLIQAFTCNAVVNPILWLGLKPIFIDCSKDTFNVDLDDLRNKISPNSKVLIVQHTFGLPSAMDEILRICQEYNLTLIEDCAHALGAKFNGRSVGTFGDAAFFSFSRDKVISSVYGGIAITNNELLAKTIKDFQKKIGYPSFGWTFQQLIHPILMNWIILPTYKTFGKYLLFFFQWLHVLSKAVHWKEKRGEKPDYFPKRMPNALAILALNQLKKIERFNNHREKIAEFYRTELKNASFELPPNVEQIYLRFTLKHPRAHEIIRKAWQSNILIGDWYDSPVAPKDTKLEKIGYQIGSCPTAEKLSKETFNLPTHINISKKEAQKIIDFLKQWR